LFLGIVAAAGLAVLGLWQPLWWIGAGLVVGWVVLYLIGLSRAEDPADELQRSLRDSDRSARSHLTVARERVR
jgi:hypothetical protein